MLSTLEQIKHQNKVSKEKTNVEIWKDDELPQISPWKVEIIDGIVFILPGAVITVSFHLTESWRHVFCLHLVGPRVQAAARTDREVSRNVRSLGNLEQDSQSFPCSSLTLGLGRRSTKLPGVILGDVSVAPDVEMVLLGVAHRLFVTFHQLLQLPTPLPLH